MKAADRRNGMPSRESPAQGSMLYAFGFSWRKRRIVRRFLHEYDLKFVARLSQVPPGSTLAVWGIETVEPSRSDLRVLRLEDGFLRSVGLGADLVHPLSWVVDGRGIYFDATRPSDLEHILQTTEFPEHLLSRATALRQRLVSLGITKYNVGNGTWNRPPDASRVILVAGQVESDASLAFGSTHLRTNLSLLQEVRRANPTAHIVYKPHPDVVAGLRRAGTGELDAAAWSNEIVTDTSLPELFNEVDEVHVLTSLCGFEAMLRGKPVTTYGQPFYAGWGLTTDIHPPARRGRKLSIEALIAGALILYPRYARLRERTPISAEQALDELVAWRNQASPHSLAKLALRPILQLVAMSRPRKTPAP